MIRSSSTIKMLIAAILEPRPEEGSNIGFGNCWVHDARVLCDCDPAANHRLAPGSAVPRHLAATAYPATSHPRKFVAFRAIH
jgi:hypothetical protein